MNLESSVSTDVYVQIDTDGDGFLSDNEFLTLASLVYKRTPTGEIMDISTADVCFLHRALKIHRSYALLDLQMEQLRNCTNENHTSFSDFLNTFHSESLGEKVNSTATSNSSSTDKDLKQTGTGGQSEDVATIYTTHVSRYGEISTKHSIRRFPSIEVTLLSPYLNS